MSDKRALAGLGQFEGTPNSVKRALAGSGQFHGPILRVTVVDCRQHNRSGKQVSSKYAIEKRLGNVRE